MNTECQPRTAVDDAIRERRTIKVLATSPLPEHDIRAIVNELAALASWAPFHRPCDSSHQKESACDGIFPWRMHVLDSAACRALRQRLPAENAGKLPAMLAAADALVQTTWLPNPPSPSFHPTVEHAFEPTLANMEHIAAASAAIENLLVAASAREMRSYWSSGGDLLRSKEVFQWLGIPEREILIGSVFLFPSEVGDSQIVGSKLRDQRPPVQSWMRWIELD